MAGTESVRWALVGGASQGIGRATAKALASKGFFVALLARRSDVLEKVKQELHEPSRHRILALDLENTDQIFDSMQRLLKETGPVGVWINCTGGPAGGRLDEASIEQLERAFKGHVLSSQIILKSLLPGMKELKMGRIINVLSTSVKAPIANLGVSNIMRAAVAAWAKTLSAELGPFGITINNVLPGYTDTPRLDSILQGVSTKTGKDKESVAQSYRDSIPMQRFASPEETAEAIAFLASEHAGYITGINLPVDGGRTGSL